MNAKAFAFLLALLAVAGCAPNRSSLSIQAACYPTDDCTFAATCDMQFIGTYQIPANGILWVPIQVANQLPDNGDVGVGRVNSNDAHVNGAIVEFEGNQTGAFTIEEVANQWIPAEGSAVIGVPIPFGAATGSVTARISLTGYYDNGNDFETGDFPLPVRVGTITDACPATMAQTCPAGTGGLGAVRTQVPAACVEP